MTYDTALDLIAHARRACAISVPPESVGYTAIAGYLAQQIVSERETTTYQVRCLREAIAELQRRYELADIQRAAQEETILALQQQRDEAFADCDRLAALLGDLEGALDL